LLVSGLTDDSDTTQAKSDNAEKPIVYTEIPFSDLRQSIKNVKESGHGFIVEAYVGQWDIQKVTLCDSPMLNFFDLPENTITFSNSIDDPYEKWPVSIIDRFDEKRKYKVYIGTRILTPIEVFARGDDPTPAAYVTEIVGLLTREQANAIREQRIADEKAADIEANKYDPSKFTIVPSNFRPADYTSIDLFKAVSDVEKMKSAFDLGYYNGGLGVRERYVSDVVFVEQNGTDIRFRTNDNAISQTMKVGDRSGLTTGQKVRLYYRVTKDLIAEWYVVAIEKR
jgi:hypothetical protein